MLMIQNESIKIQFNHIKKLIEKNHVELLHLQFVDLEGILKQVTITAEQLEDSINGKIMFDGSSICGFTTINKSDLYLKPDLDTFAILPWTCENNCTEARFICSVTNPDGTPFQGDPRYVLQKTINQAKDQGYSISIGPELEFFLFQLDADGKPTVLPQDNGCYFDPSSSDLGDKVRLEIYRALRAMGFNIEASHHEVAQGQHEISFQYSNALCSADRATTYKWVVKTIAKRHGLCASFMPKPIFNENGSGMHVNISLFQDGINAFYDKKDPLELSKTAYQFISGVLRHVKSFTAITNPLVNSYKRLIPGFEAPCYIAWSASNRSALIRIPANRESATRVEIRHPDPTANPYLAYAVIATAGLDGIENELPPYTEITDDIFKMSSEVRMDNEINSLPDSLEAALNYLEAGEIGRKVLGNHIYQAFFSLKQKEWNSYRTAVHAWELECYQTKF